MEIEFLEDALLIKGKILVVGDLHIGYEEYILGKEMGLGIQFKEILEKFERIFGELKKKKRKIKKIVILGDLKHEFGEISKTEWNEVLKLLDYLKENVEKVILVKGNHDNIVGPLIKRKEVVMKDFHNEKEIGFFHGDVKKNKKLQEKIKKEIEKVKVMILGHIHPTIILEDEYKREKYKCFLKGWWKGKKVYILPAFGYMIEGYGLNELRYKESEKDFFIIDNKKLMDFEVLIYNEKEKEVYNFKKLKNLI